jgi:hypothetical protein
LLDWKEKLLVLVKDEISSFEYKILEENEVRLNYPVQSYPEKVSSHSLDKNQIIEGFLVGIKGQYLIFDSGVFNVRAHTGYEINIEV